MTITEGELKWGMVKMMDVTGGGVTEVALIRAAIDASVKNAARRYCKPRTS